MKGNAKENYCKNKKSDKWKKLNKPFGEKVKLAKKSLYSNFVQDLKISNPSQWYRKLKRLAAYDQVNFNSVQVEELEGCSNQEAANKISESFAAISQKFKPIQLDKLPSFRPTLEVPKIDPHQVAIKISKMKKTKSTLEGDLRHTLCKEFSNELAIPLANIFLIALLKKVNIHHHGNWNVCHLSPKSTHQLKYLTSEKFLVQNTLANFLKIS